MWLKNVCTQNNMRVNRILKVSKEENVCLFSALGPGQDLDWWTFGPQPTSPTFPVPQLQSGNLCPLPGESRQSHKSPKFSPSDRPSLVYSRQSGSEEEESQVQAAETRKALHPNLDSEPGKCSFNTTLLKKKRTKTLSLRFFRQRFVGRCRVHVSECFSTIK